MNISHEQFTTATIAGISAAFSSVGVKVTPAGGQQHTAYEQKKELTLEERLKFARDNDDLLDHRFEYVSSPKRAKVISRAYELYKELGYYPAAISRKLNKEGLNNYDGSPYAGPQISHMIFKTVPKALEYLEERGF